MANKTSESTLKWAVRVIVMRNRTIAAIEPETNKTGKRVIEEVPVTIHFRLIRIRETAIVRVRRSTMSVAIDSRLFVTIDGTNLNGPKPLKITKAVRIRISDSGAKRAEVI